MSSPIKLLILTACLSVFIQSQRCSSACIDYTNTCSGTGYGQCTVCAVSIFNLVPDSSGCVLLNQTAITTLDLTYPISLAGFQSNTYEPVTCGGYQLSGQYGAGSYLSKIYDTPLAHYQLKLRFNVIFMGSWSSADYLTVAVDSAPYTVRYSCLDTENLCNSTDCFRIKEVNATHRAETALVKFTSSISNNPPVQSWGIKDLLVVLKTCHSRCTSCYGASTHECYTCASGFFLLGNSCVDQCPVYGIPTLHVCSLSCPQNFYAQKTTKTCETCATGCAFCNGPLSEDCLIQTQIESLWDRKKEFWIFLIVIGSIMLAMAIYCLIQRRRAKISSLNEPIMGSNANFEAAKGVETQNNFTLDDKVKDVRNKIVDKDAQSVSSGSDSNGSDDSHTKKKRKWRGEEQQL